MQTKKWSTGGKRYGRKGLWQPFCEYCCYREGGVCQKSGLRAGVDHLYRLQPAFEKCPLWPHVEEKMVATRKVFKYTFEGSIRNTFSNQQYFEKTRDPVRYRVEYTYEEFRRRLLRLGYRRRWLAWVNSGFDAGLRPVVARRYKTKGYTRLNIFLK